MVQGEIRDGNSLAEYASEASERVFSLSLENLSEAKRSEASWNGVAPSFERARKNSLAALASDASETPRWYQRSLLATVRYVLYATGFISCAVPGQQARCNRSRVSKYLLQFFLISITNQIEFRNG